MADEMRSLQLPEGLCRQAEQRYAGHYGSLEHFLAFVLQQLVREEASQMDRNEQNVIEERLKDLGYI